MTITAVIFDLDGVLVSTDRFHYQAWKAVADDLGVPFNEEVNHQLRGVSRMDSLNIILNLSLIHISEPTRLGMISYAVFCLKYQLSLIHI